MFNKFKKCSAFTLVELAVVLVIIGMIIVGILQGQKMLLNAKVTASVAQIKEIEAAVTNFKDLYKKLPGDLPTSGSAIEGCGGSSTTNAYCIANGDGSIGEPDWDMFTYQPAAQRNNASCNRDSAGNCSQGYETLLFWYSLQKAGLISGVTNEIAGDVTPSNIVEAFGRTIMASRNAGGFWVGNSLNGNLGRRAGNYTLFGTVLSTVRLPADNIDVTSRGGILTPVVAAIMDRKIDDGLPASGAVQAYGYDTASGNTSCFGDDDRYQESVANLDCGLHIRIQR